MRWMRDHLKLDHESGFNRANVVIMPSNTERDDRFSDNPGDADRISGGRIDSQARGSANAADASYFVPLDALAGAGTAMTKKAQKLPGMQITSGTQLTNSSCWPA